MRPMNTGRVAGLWYLGLIFAGPLRLIYIPATLFVRGDAHATMANIAAHETLFRAGLASELFCAVVLIMLVLAFYRLFAPVDRLLAAQIVIFGGVMPAALALASVMTDAGALLVARGAGFLAPFTEPQREALGFLLLKLHDEQTTAAEILWGVWLFPLALLVWRSRFLPRFLGVWLALGGLAYVLLSLAGELAPSLQNAVFKYAQPAFFGELALTAWLLAKGATPATSDHAFDQRQYGESPAR